MHLKFPYHFQFRLHERGINIDHIKKAILAPDNIQNVFGGRVKVQKKISQKTIKLVYYKNTSKDKREEYNIITAYYI